MTLLPWSRSIAASPENWSIPSSSTLSADDLVMGEDLAWTSWRNLVVRRKTGWERIAGGMSSWRSRWSRIWMRR